MPRYELLAPAGDFSMLNAAVNAGADAVYFGLKGSNMRANAKNFTIKDLKKIKQVCGDKVKKYLTMNIIVYDNELSKIEKTIIQVKDYVDAIICWDLAVIGLCKKHKIPFHISTQASISNSEAAKFYTELGAERIVLARELNLKQVKEISKVTEIETFIHGAMCLAISGRCLMSQFIHNKSANRGECLQPCRRTYNVIDPLGKELKIENHRVLSPKDLCTLPFIESLKKAGVKSFKIEGRNKDARYVDTVVRVYRKALDNKLSKDEVEEGLKELSEVYNKGFSSGFYLGLPTSDDFTKSEHSSSNLSKVYVGKIVKYLPKKEIGIIKIESNPLEINDELIIIGKDIGIIKQKISYMEMEGLSVNNADKGQLVGIKLPKLRKNQEIYKIKNKN